MQNRLRNLILFIFFLSSLPLHAKLEDHFRKIEKKNPAVHRMRGIDFIYMINLDVRPEKYLKSVRALLPWRIFPYRFSAVNGWELTLDVINDVGLKYKEGMAKGLIGTCYLTPDKKPSHEKINKAGQTYFFYHPIAEEHLPLGAIGICLSHLSILQDAYDSNYETIWVMEDDIEVLSNPQLLTDLIRRLDQEVGRGNWDVLFTDRDLRDKNGKYVPCTGYEKRPNFEPQDPSRFAKREKISKDFTKIGARFGAHSMILRRSGIEKILNFIKTYGIFLPYDMDYYMVDGIRLFSLNEDVVGNLPNATSDNRSKTYSEGTNHKI